jgi:hypothetical protein
MSGPVEPGANRARQPFDSGQEIEREPLMSGEAIMYNQSRGECRTCRPAGAADQLGARVSSRLGGPPVLPSSRVSQEAFRWRYHTQSLVK